MGICREFQDYFQKLFAKEFDNYLTVFSRLETTESVSCWVLTQSLSRTIQDNIRLVRMTSMEKVDEEDVLIRLDQSKDFDRLNYRLSETVLSAAEFKSYFCSWVRLLYPSPGYMVEVNRVWSKLIRYRPYSFARIDYFSTRLYDWIYVRAFLSEFLEWRDIITYYLN